jgi:sRNA-binding regulator protein Hfq
LDIEEAREELVVYKHAVLDIAIREIVKGSET